MRNDISTFKSSVSDPFHFDPFREKRIGIRLGIWPIYILILFFSIKNKMLQRMIFIVIHRIVIYVSQPKLLFRLKIDIFCDLEFWLADFLLLGSGRPKWNGSIQIWIRNTVWEITTHKPMLKFRLWKPLLILFSLWKIYDLSRCWN